MRYILTLAFLVIYAASAAQAQRSIGFAPYAVPEAGDIVVPVREGNLAAGVVAEVNTRTGGALATAIDDAGYKGEAGEVLTLFGLRPYKRIDLIGVGAEPLLQRDLQDFGGRAAAANDGGRDISILWAQIPTAVEAAAAHIAFGFTLGDYRFDQYQQKDADEPATRGDLTIATAAADASAAAYEDDLSHLATAVLLARDLVTEPGNIVYPQSFVERVRSAFRGVRDVSIDVLDVAAMRRLDMGLLLGVGQGSQRPPRLLVVRYGGGQRDAAPLVFVGKGVTFDTGGISIKPSKNMSYMKADMSGAAAVTATVLALAKRKAPVNAIAVAALAENMPSGSAIRPGDVVASMSGKTVEILNTDAEGRLILADAVHYAQDRFQPRLLVDIATLTGSAARALGAEYAALFTRDDDLAAQVTRAGAIAGEDVWRLPLHPNHDKRLESDIADIKNVSPEPPGASIGAAFIGAFVRQEQPWVHLDIAGVAWRTDTVPTVPKGFSGWSVRLLDQLVRQLDDAGAAQ